MAFNDPPPPPAGIVLPLRHINKHMNIHLTQLLTEVCIKGGPLLSLHILLYVCDLMVGI